MYERNGLFRISRRASPLLTVHHCSSAHVRPHLQPTTRVFARGLRLPLQEAYETTATPQTLQDKYLAAISRPFLEKTSKTTWYTNASETTKSGHPHQCDQQSRHQSRHFLPHHPPHSPPRPQHPCTTPSTPSTRQKKRRSRRKRPKTAGPRYRKPSRTLAHGDETLRLRRKSGPN